MQKAKKHYTIMFIPEGNAKTFSIHINRSIIHSLVIFVIVFFIGFIGLVLKSGDIAAKLQLVNTLRSENKKLIDENKKLNFVREKIEKIETMGAYLQRLATAAGDSVKRQEYAVNLASRSGETVYKKDVMDETVDKIRLANTDVMRTLKQKEDASDGFLAAVPNIQPTEGWITRKFVVAPNDSEQAHTGIDFAATSGTLIRATARGVVEDVYKDPYFGLIVTLKHGYGFVTRYGHCLQILVTKGDHVERGQTIALVGNTGRSSAPHLHYEVIKDGRNVDPLEYFFRTSR
jgi:murein DD-endopeptidase MepM/ murein hydrolase activator NlpD